MMSAIHFDAGEDFNLTNTTQPRSLLVALVPFEGHNTMQEGLLSLLVRTSNAHGVNVRQLIDHVLGDADSTLATLTGSSFFRKHAGTMNGLGHYAGLFTRALSSLTGAAHLAQTTLLPWKDLFPFNGQGLLTARPKWCPECLRHQRIGIDVCWHPLAWSLETFRVCPEHQCALEDTCPHCGKFQSFVPRYPDLSICQHCGRFMGGQRAPRDRADSDLWLAQAVGNMVAQQGQQGFVPTVEHFRRYLEEQVNHLTNGNRAEFSRQLGLNTHVLNGWLRKGERPSFSHFMMICRGLNVMPADVFSSRQRDVRPPGLRRPELFMTRKPSARVTEDARTLIEMRLKEMLEGRQGWSVRRIAKELGVGVNFLKYRFPELCAQLSEVYRDVTTNRSIEHRQRQAARVVEIVMEIRATGAYPSHRKVNTRLRQEKMSLLQPHLAIAYKEACEGLGQDAPEC